MMHTSAEYAKAIALAIVAFGATSKITSKPPSITGRKRTGGRSLGTRRA
jgi:hypothetical protein